MKRIIFVLPSLKAVSPVKSAFSLIKTLMNDYDVHVISLDADVTEGFSIKKALDSCGIKYSFLNESGLRRVFAAKKKLQNYIDCHRPDIIISYLLRPDLVVSLIKTKAKKITSIRNMIEHEYVTSYGVFFGKLFGYLHKRALKKFDKIIVMSKDMENYFISCNFSGEKLELIYNFLDEADVGKKLPENVLMPFESDLPIVVSVSSLIRRKNIKLMLESSLELMTQGIKFNVLIIGDGEERSMLESFIQSNILYSDRFYFLGHIENPIPYINKSDIFIMTSISEGVSRSLMEALYLGKLCIVSNIDGNRELINNGVNGFLFNDKEELVTLMRNSLTQPSIIRPCLDQKFRFEHSVESHKRLLLKIVEDTK